jgi:hypothetical protein
MEPLDLISVVSLILAIIVVVIIIVSWIINMNIALELNKAIKIGNYNEETCGERYLEGESHRNIVYETYVNKLEKKYDTILKLLSVMYTVTTVSVVLISLLVFIISVKYRYCPKILNCGPVIISFIIFVLNVFAVIFFNIMQKKIISKISFIIGTDEQKDSTVNKQITKNVWTLLIFLVSLFTYHFYVFKNLNFTGGNSITISIALFVIVLILITTFQPIITGDKFDMGMIKTYYYNNAVSVDNEDSLANMITDSYLSNSSLQNHIRNNIRNLENINETPAIGGEYLSNIYKYVMHEVNQVELRNVKLPKQLKDKVKSIYLNGENLLILKSDLIRYYNTPIRNEDKVKILKRYFKNPDEIDATFYETLNEQLENSDSINASSNLTTDIRNKLLFLRNDNFIENLVNQHYNKTKKVSYIVLFLMTYLLVHTLYNKSNYSRSLFTLSLFVIMLIYGSVGWVFRQMWI